MVGKRSARIPSVATTSEGERAMANFLGADTAVLGGQVTAACGKAATRADQIAASLRSIADNKCPVFGPNGETLATQLRELADGLSSGLQRLAAFKATAQRNATEQDKASGIQSAGGGQSGPMETGTDDGGWGNSVWDEVIGFLNMVGGGAEVVAGVGLLEFYGVGAIPIVHGLDTMYAGYRSWSEPNDEIYETYTGKFIREQAIEAGYTPNEAAWISTGAELAIGLGSGLAAKWAKGIKLATTAGSAADEAGESIARVAGAGGGSIDDMARGADDVARAAAEESGPWMRGVKGVEYGGEVVAQSRELSCTSAAGEMLTGGAVKEAQILSVIGEDQPVTRLIGVLNDMSGGPNYAGQFFDNGAQALEAARGGPMAAQLQVPFTKAHTVFIEPLSDGRFLVRDPGTTAGAVYKVGEAWIKQYVAGGVWRAE